MQSIFTNNAICVYNYTRNIFGVLSGKDLLNILDNPTGGMSGPFCEAGHTRNTVCTPKPEFEEKSGGMKTCYYTCHGSYNNFNELFIVLSGTSTNVKLCGISY